MINILSGKKRDQSNHNQHNTANPFCRQRRDGRLRILIPPAISRIPGRIGSRQAPYAESKRRQSKQDISSSAGAIPGRAGYLMAEYLQQFLSRNPLPLGIVIAPPAEAGVSPHCPPESRAVRIENLNTPILIDTILVCLAPTREDAVLSVYRVDSSILLHLINAGMGLPRTGTQEQRQQHQEE